VIVAWRRLRMTGAEIAFCLGMALSTVSAVLLRVGLASSAGLSPHSPPTATSAATLASCCIDVKQLGRIRGAGRRVTGSLAS